MLILVYNLESVKTVFLQKLAEGFLSSDLRESTLSIMLREIELLKSIKTNS